MRACRDPRVDLMPVSAPSSKEVELRVAEGSNVWVAASDGDIERVKFLLEHGSACMLTSGAN